jgi:hypothetical protein
MNAVRSKSKPHRQEFGLSLYLPFRASVSFALVILLTAPQRVLHASLMDRDADGDVDGIDFSIFAACYNKAGNPPRTLFCEPEDRIAFDTDGDGDIDGIDFAQFANCFNAAGNPPRCNDPPFTFQVRNADELIAALATARPDDTIKTIVPRINMPTYYVIPPGVTLTSDGTRDNRLIVGGIIYVAGQQPDPVDVTIRNLTIGGPVILIDPANTLIEDCYIDGDGDDTGIRPPTNAFWFLVWKRPVTTATVRRCEPRNFQNDGFSISHKSGGTQSDASGGTLIIEDGYLDENSNMGLDLNDQPLTAHDRGRLIVHGGRYGPTPADSMVASGAVKSPIELYDATFVGGGIQGTIVERCTVTDAGGHVFTFYPWNGSGHVIDTVCHDNLGQIVLTGFLSGHQFDIKRCSFTYDQWENPSPTVTVRGLTLEELATVVCESSIFIGNRRASNGVSRAVMATGIDSFFRAITINNCLFHNWGAVYNVRNTNFNYATFYNNVHLDNVSIATALSAGILTGDKNFYDQGTNALVLPGATHFPNGDGADAYDMVDYLNHDFHPTGPTNDIKALGAPNTAPTYDFDGNLFNQLAPDLGPYVVPN